VFCNGEAFMMSLSPDPSPQSSPSGRGGHRPWVSRESGWEAVREAPGEGCARSAIVKLRLLHNTSTPSSARARREFSEIADYSAADPIPTATSARPA
jgi:hypothetical protein